MQSEFTPSTLRESLYSPAPDFQSRLTTLNRLWERRDKPPIGQISTSTARRMIEIIGFCANGHNLNFPLSTPEQPNPVDKAVNLLIGSFTHPPVPNSDYSYAGEIFQLLPPDERMMNPQDIIYNYSQVCRDMHTANQSGTPLSRELKQKAAFSSLRMISLLGSNAEFKFKDRIASKVAGVIRNNHLGEEIGKIVEMKREETEPIVPEEKPPSLPDAPTTLPHKSPEVSPPSAAPHEHEDTSLQTHLAEEIARRKHAEEEITRLQGQLTAEEAARKIAEEEAAALLRTQLDGQVSKPTQAPEKPGEETFSEVQEKEIGLREARARASGFRDGQKWVNVEADNARKLADEAHQLAIQRLQSDHDQKITALQAELSAGEEKANTRMLEANVKLKAAEQKAREAESARNLAQRQEAAANKALAREAQAITAQQAEIERLKEQNAEQMESIADLEARLRMQLAGEQDILQRLSEASEAQKGGITLDPAARQIIAEALAIENYPLDGLNPELAAFIAELRKSLEKIVTERAKKIASGTGQLKTKGPPKPDQEPASAPNPDAGGFEDIEL